MLLLLPLPPPPQEKREVSRVAGDRPSGSMPAAAGKKLRKPYTIARPREKWTAEEHGRFLHAMLLYVG